MPFRGDESARRRFLAVLLTFAVLAAPFLLLASGPASATGVSLDTTGEFDAGTKSAPGDGNLGVETSTDNPGIAVDRLELASLKGDAFGTPDADADTWKWDVPATCTIRSPTTIIRTITGGTIQLGSNRSSGSTRVGVVASAGLMGDVDVVVKVTELEVQDDSRFSFQLLNEKRCYYSSNPRTADGIEFEIDYSAVSKDYMLRPYTVANGTEVQCSSGPRVAATTMYLRLTRSGTAWAFSYSLDGTAWTRAAACSPAASGPMYASLFVKDPKAGKTTTYALDDYRAIAGSVAAGGFRTSGDWTSAPFAIPLGEILDRVEVTGTFDATYALDRVELLQGGSVVEASEDDNDLVVTPASQVSGADIQVRLYLKGNGAGTPAVTRVEAFFRTAFTVTGETVVLGTSSGILNETASDDVYDVKTEALGPVSSVVRPDAESVVAGTRVSGTPPPSPSDVDASDDVSVVYREANAATFDDTPPDALTLSSGSFDAGMFPACAATDDGGPCTFTEEGTTTEAAYAPASATVAVGSQETGTFPADLEGSDDLSIEYREGDSGTLQTYYLPATETLLKGVAGSGLPYAQGTFTRKTDGPGIQHVMGVGLHGRALILWWTRQTAIGTRAQHSSGIGLVASPAQQYAVAWADDDAQSPSNAGRRSAAAAITILLNGTPALDGEASFIGFTDDGFDLDWFVNPGVAEATIIHYIALGSVVTNAYVGQFTGPPAGVLGSRSYSGMGFQGDAAIFLGSFQTALGNANHAAMGFGVATGPFNRASVSIEVPDGTTTADTEVVQDNRRALMMYNPALAEPTTDQLIDFVSFNADGFTLNHLKATSGNVLFWTLVLKGGAYRANAFLRQTTVGDQAVTGLGFRPNGVLMFGGSSYLAYGSEDTGAEVVFGAGSRVTGTLENTVTWAGSNDAVNPTNANAYTSAAYVLADLSLSSQSLQNLATFKSSDADGFTVTWPTIQSGSGQKWFYLAFGGSGTGNAFPGCAQASDDSRCAYAETFQADTSDYRAEVRYGWTGVDTTGTEWRLFVEGREAASNAETIDVRVYGSDDVTLSSVVCSLVSTTEALYDCGLLTADQLNGGSPDVLLSDAVRSPDGSASSFEIDQAYIRQSVSTKGLEARHEWSWIPIGGAAFELRIEGRVADEAVNVQVLTSPLTWTTRLTLSSTADANLTYMLTVAEFNGGAPSVRFVDATPTDGLASSVWLDRVLIVALDTTYALEMIWDWTGTVDASGPTSLAVRAAITGDTEGILAEVYDWEDGSWRPAFTITSASETEVSSVLLADCTPVLGDCEVSPTGAGSVRVRFTDLDPSDGEATSLTMDIAVVRQESAGYVVAVEYTFATLGGRSGEDALRIEGNRTDEDIAVQVWQWDSGDWATRLTIPSATETILVHVLLDAELSPTFEVRVRFVGTSEVTDAVESEFRVDYLAVEKREYGLDIVNVISGLTGTGPFVLHLEGRIAESENFDVWVFNWTSSSWVPWLDSSLSGVDQTFDRALAADEIGAGEVHVRFGDDVSTYDESASTLLVDFLGVS